MVWSRYCYILIDGSMRIGIEVQRLFRVKKHGMEVAAMELIRQIQSQDTRNEYIVFAKKDEDMDCIRESSNLRIQTFDAFSYGDWEQFKLPAAANKAGVNFLHCTCNTGPLRLRLPIVLTLHDIIYLEKIELKGTSYQNFGNIYRRFVVPKVVDRSRTVITVSHFERTLILEKLKLPEEKLKVVYNGVSSRFHPNYSADELELVRKKYNLPSQFILFLGNTAPKKNTRNVIRAFADYCNRAKDQLPLVVLDYDKQLVADTLAELGSTKCLSRIIFPGYVSPDAMPVVYKAATIFLYPSLRESFGLPILESMGCGTPVVTSTTSSMPEVAADAAVMVDPYKYREISDSILHLLDNQQVYDDFVIRGYARAAQFTWENSVKQLLEVYKEAGA